MIRHLATSLSRIATRIEDLNLSANIELALLTKVMEERDFHTLEKAGINEGFFLTPEAREVYRWIRDMYHEPATAGHVPSTDLARYRFPTLFFQIPIDSVPVLCAQLRQEKIRIELLSLAQILQERAGLDIPSAMAELRAKSTELSSLTEAGEDLSMAAAFNQLWDQYSMIQNTAGMLGIPYPWDALNEETQGMQNGQFIVLYGRPKSMKTWMAIHFAATAYVRYRKRVLFYSREMTPRQISMRVACAIARVDYKAFRLGRLQPEIRDRVFSILRELADDERSAGSQGRHQPWFVITTDRGRGGRGSGGVGWLQSKIRDLKPDMAVVDGMYLMKDDRTNQRSVDWRQITHISQDLKLTAQEFDIPIIGVTQANRQSQKSKGEDLTELAFSDALGQDADAIFRTSLQVKVDETGVKRTSLFITAPGLREGVFEGIVVRGEPATNFDYIRTMVAEDSENEDYDDKKKAQTIAQQTPRRTGYARQQFVDPRINNRHMR